MKKRLFLVGYSFTLAGHRYDRNKLVTIKYEGMMDDEWGSLLAASEVEHWFEQFTDCTPIRPFVASPALEKVYIQPKFSEKDLVTFGNKMITKQAKASEKTDVSDADLANFKENCAEEERNIDK